MGIRLMHLSDLHLGGDIVLRALWRRRAWWGQADEAVTQGLKKAIRELQPDYIVISGDFVNKAKDSTFSGAADFLRKLFLDSGFDLKERLLVIPGNHDVSFYPRKHPDDPERLHRYKEFLRVLYGESDLESRKQRFTHIDTRKKAIFLCLDSTLKNLPPGAEGEIGSSQRAWIERKMKQYEQQLGGAFKHYVKVAVVHHHVVPITGTGISSERFMQLLDSADVLTLLQKYAFNIVLHGHKHVPHTKPLFGSDSSVLTIIGAGTTMCRFLEEQHTFGNNFNLVEVAPELNQFRLRLFRANPVGEFLPTGGEETLPLFRVQPAGFTASRMRKTITVERDGVTRVVLAKEHLRVERAGTVIKTLPFRVFTEAKGSKITDFWVDLKHGRVEKRVDSDTFMEGDFVLKEPLTFGGQDINQFYSYTVVGGTAMSIQGVRALYSDGRDTERTSMVVTNPILVLEMELNLPRGYPSVPKVVFEAHGAVIPGSQLNHSFEQVDISLNRWVLRVDNPPIDHSITLEWTVPETWNGN